MKLLFSLLLLGICALSAVAQIPKIESGVSHDLAAWRAAHYSDVRYKLDLTLEKMSPVLKGTIEIRVHLLEPPASAGGQLVSPGTTPIILDWRRIAGHEKDSTISNVTINGKSVTAAGYWETILSDGEPHIFYDGYEHLEFHYGVVRGENVIKLDFTSPILTSGSAITRYIDKEDGSEYIYSQLSPSNASTAFPMFKQPDLKARFKVEIWAPQEWMVIGNAASVYLYAFTSDIISASDDVNISPLELEHLKASGKPYGIPFVRAARFPETKPVSPDDFAFAAGPWRQMSTTIGNEDTTHWNDPDFHLNVYVRESQAAKFQLMASGIFKTARETDKYFDHKAAWPKYDLVLIPDLPSEMIQAAGITFVRESSIIGDK